MIGRGSMANVLHSIWSLKNCVIVVRVIKKKKRINRASFDPPASPDQKIIL